MALMGDQAPNTSENGSGDQKQESQDQSTQQDGKQQEQEPKNGTFTQADVDRIAAKARDDGRQAALDEVKKKQQEDDQKAKGQFEELLKTKDAEIEGYRRQVAERDLADKRKAIGARHHLPDSVSALLTGEKDDEIEELAKKLAKELGVSEKSKETEKKTSGKQPLDPKDGPPEKQQSSQVQPTFAFSHGRVKRQDRQ